MESERKNLLSQYNAIGAKTFDDLLDFHYRFERIHPFNERGYLRDTCMSAQDKFNKYLDYFRIPYDG